MKTALALLLGSCAWAQIEPPQLGVMLTRDGTARQVFGVAGSVTLGSNLPGVISMGCSRAVCLFKGKDVIFSATGSVPAPAGHAVFSFGRAGALIYFTAVRQLVSWRDNQLSPVEFDVSGEILSIHDGLFAVRRATGVWIVQGGDRIVAALPRGVRAVLLTDDGVIFATAHALVLRRADASELRFEIEHVEALSWLGENYVQVRTRESIYALRVEAGRERAFLLPEPLPEPQP